MMFASFCLAAITEGGSLGSGDLTKINIDWMRVHPANVHLCIVLCVPQIQVMCPSFNDNSCQCIRHTLCNLERGAGGRGRERGEGERERERCVHSPTSLQVCPIHVQSCSLFLTLTCIALSSTQPVKNHYRIAGNIGGNWWLGPKLPLQKYWWI